MKLDTLTPNIMVDDMAATVAFYRDVLGFEFAMCVPEQAPFNWVLLRHGTVSLMFQTRASLSEELPFFENKTLGGGLTFYIRMEGIEAYLDSLKDRVDLVKGLNRTFYGAVEFTIRDINGHLLTFAQHDQG